MPLADLKSLGKIWAMRKEAFIEYAKRSKKNSAAPKGKLPKVQGGIAIISLSGLLAPKIPMWYGTDTNRVSSMFAAAIQSDDIGAVVFDVDSPGGTSHGCMELSKQIFDARGVKPIIAVANHMAASAGLWIPSSADQFIVAPSGEIGSVGVWSLHVDYSKMLEDEGLDYTFVSAGKYKVEGNFSEPLSEEAEAEMQRSVNEVYADFIAGLSRNYGVSKSKVEKDFGQGRMFSAERAIEAGIAHGVDTFSNVLSRLHAKNGKRGKRSDSELSRWLSDVGTVPSMTIAQARLQSKARRRKA